MYIRQFLGYKIISSWTCKELYNFLPKKKKESRMACQTDTFPLYQITSSDREFPIIT
jgi:hypothetical protein